MNDITALMATMKAAAEKAKHAGETPVMHFDERISALNAFQLAACPANVKTLVEALEKAQAQSSKWFEAYHKAVSVGARYEERIAELESYSKTAIEFREAARDENRHLKLELEIAEKRVVELESRTVTVKLPRRVGAKSSWQDGPLMHADEVIAALAAAGIQVIEGDA